jgi:hypothetical protein
MMGFQKERDHILKKRLQLSQECLLRRIAVQAGPPGFRIPRGLDGLVEPDLFQLFQITALLRPLSLCLLEREDASARLQRQARLGLSAQKGLLGFA